MSDYYIGPMALPKDVLILLVKFYSYDVVLTVLESLHPEEKGE